jgi:hypothetical protein
MLLECVRTTEPFAEINDELLAGFALVVGHGLCVLLLKHHFTYFGIKIKKKI